MTITQEQHAEQAREFYNNSLRSLAQEELILRAEYAESLREIASRRRRLEAAYLDSAEPVHSGKHMELCIDNLPDPDITGLPR